MAVRSSFYGPGLSSFFHIHYPLTPLLFRMNSGHVKEWIHLTYLHEPAGLNRNLLLKKF